MTLVVQTNCVRLENAEERKNGIPEQRNEIPEIKML